MPEQIYGIDEALAILAASGAAFSRPGFSVSLLKTLAKAGHAEKHGRGWAFNAAALRLWGAYVAEVRKRKGDGRLPGNYGYNHIDMENFHSGEWDE